MYALFSFYFVKSALYWKSEAQLLTTEIPVVAPSSQSYQHRFTSSLETQSEHFDALRVLGQKMTRKIFELQND